MNKIVKGLILVLLSLIFTGWSYFYTRDAKYPYIKCGIGVNCAPPPASYLNRGLPLAYVLTADRPITRFDSGQPIKSTETTYQWKVKNLMVDLLVWLGLSSLLIASPHYIKKLES